MTLDSLRSPRHHRVPDGGVKRCADRQRRAWSRPGRAASKRTAGEDHHRSTSAEPLSRGRVVIQYRAEHLHIVPVFGPAALACLPVSDTSM